MFVNLSLDLGDTQECPVPACLQFCRDQAVGGIGRIVLTECPISSVANGFEVTQQRLSYLVAPRASFRLGRYCRRDRTGANNLEQRGFDRVVDPQSAKGDAARLAVVEQPSMAGVARNIMLRAGVADSQLASATAATDQTGEQGITMLGSTMMPALRPKLTFDLDRLVGAGYYYYYQIRWK